MAREIKLCEAEYDRALTKLMLRHNVSEPNHFLRFEAWEQTVGISNEDRNKFNRQAEYVATIVGKMAALRSRIDARWVYICGVFLESPKGRIRGPISTVIVPVLSNGGVLEGCFVVDHDLNHLYPHSKISFPPEWDDFEGIASWITGWFVFPCLKAITLIHCKNIVKDTYDPPPAIEKKFKDKQRERGVKPGREKPLSRYHTLAIIPMKDIVRRRGQLTPEAMKRIMSIHIRIGHERDYREKGLFGKDYLRGVYYFPDTVVGSRNAGTVVEKDYEVQVPEDFDDPYS
jgi:hypothetical protein